MNYALTTTQSQHNSSNDMSRFIEQTRIPYIPRRRRGLAQITAEHGLQGIIVWEPAGPVLYTENGKFFFHPSMAKCRIGAFRKQRQEDLMIRACQLTRGDSFLDCTLGLGTDAIVAAYFSEHGIITGLESQPVVAAVISWGMKLYQGKMDWLNQAVKRVAVINVDHKGYLSQLADNSFDIVYFDPMFNRPLLKSQPIGTLRGLANYAVLEEETIQHACRVARKRVVMKTLRTGDEISRLGMQEFAGSQHNPIVYGFISLL